MLTPPTTNANASESSTTNNTMFEIHVAVIGYVSVGKTTVINALFGAEYGEVAMKRTTAVVNYFRVSSESSSSSSQDDDSIEIVSKKFSASATLKETATDNGVFRNSNSTVVKERTFDICLEEPLHEMRPDTKLVIVDIPGMNEAGTSSKYKDFVKDRWHTFDIVVVVMDARQGVNTEEQHALLQLVKENLETTKNLPVIIIGNKVDDPDNPEQTALLGEARAAVEQMFQVADRQAALADLLLHHSQNNDGQPPDGSLFPAVVPISAMHAFVYRCGSRLSFEEFCQMDTDFIHKIGKDSYGRQWHRFGKKKQLEKAFEAVSEDEQRQDGVDASNFESFIKLLSACIGNEDQQARLIETQIDVALQRMKRPTIMGGPNDDNCDLSTELVEAQNKLVALGKSTDHLPAAFWESYQRLKKEAFDGFLATTCAEFSPKLFSHPVQQLFNYVKVLSTLKDKAWIGEMEKAIKASKEFALQSALQVIAADAMKTKSAKDQFLILGSMLLCSSETAFNMHFGSLRLHLEAQYMDTKYMDIKSANGMCPSCKIKTTVGEHGQGTEHCGSCGKIYIELGTTNCPGCLFEGEGLRVLSHKKDGNGNEIASCDLWCNNVYHIRRPRCHEMKVLDGKLVPVDEDSYKENVTVTVPDSLDDPEHFGHVLWKSCELLKEAGV